MTNFRNLKIWQKGMELVINVYQLSEMLPNEERFGLRSQITRAVISIPSNIAEGSRRKSQKDFKRFLEIALGSAFELETQLLIIHRLKLVKIDLIDPLINELHEVQKMTNRFISSLKR